ncbi:MAG: DUF4276 family protein [Campylobacterota bacterium]|nr:DUF4276 family protein [Campylobacterota bacterium]
MKIGLIVEGDSDKDFFEKYFKPNFKRDIIVTSPGKKGICKILNREKIHQDIKALFARGCKEVHILIDLDTQCDRGKKFTCIVELKKWYRKKVSLETKDNVAVTIVSKEIEAWMLSAWENSNNKSKQDLEKHFKTKKSLNEKELLKKFIDSRRSIDRVKNASLDYFFIKIGL